MKGISSQTGLEIEIDPFIIELDSPCSTAPPSPTRDANKHHFWPDVASWKTSDATDPPSRHATCRAFDFLSDTDDESILEFLFEPVRPSLTLLGTLAQDPSPASRAAILYYLPLTPVVQADIPALVCPLLDDEEVMISLATNIAYFHAQDMVSESELEYLLMEILVGGSAGADPCVKLLHLYHFTQWQIQRYRKALIPQQQQNEQKCMQQELKIRARHREKTWRRKRAEVQQSLGIQQRVQLTVPLPHGCKTNADVFTDVNEMYDPSARPLPPRSDWAQSIPHSNESKGIYKKRPCVNLPSTNADMRTPQAADVSKVRDDQLLKVRASLEPLCFMQTSAAEITIKLPDPACYLQT